MIFTEKKAIFNVVIPLFVIITKEVNSFFVKSDTIKEATKSIRTLARSVLNQTYGYIEKPNLNCLGISKTYFGQRIDALLTADVTKARSVKFYFASQRQPHYLSVTITNSSSLLIDLIDFDPYRHTVLISHGFMSSGKDQWLQDMADAFLRFADVNVILVDWREGSNTWNYIAAATSTHVVGNQIAALFEQIFDEMVSRQYDLDGLGNIHFVGHSLGAHIVARAANVIRENRRAKYATSSWIVKRITGLDPAQPCFITDREKLKLDRGDAEFVDVIHTNARHLMLLGLGLPDQIGHMDFYPNGGQIQPGCSNVDVSVWQNYLSVPGNLIRASICSHGRSYLFFTESINSAIAANCSFVSHPWNREYDESKIDELVLKKCVDIDCPQMGIYSDNLFPRTRGIYFTPTGHEAPYCVVKEIDEKLIDKQMKADVSVTRTLKSLLSG